MKIRNGFVSNSSSASFIIKFSFTGEQDDVINKLRKSSEWVDKQWEDWTASPDSIFKEERTFQGNKHGLVFDGKEATYQLYTTMFNDWADIGGWKFVRALSDNRIPGMKLSSLIQTEDEYNSCHKEVEFDKWCWEYDSCIINPWRDKIDDEDVKEAKEKQDELELEYMIYLSNIGATFTDEEKVYLAKGQLSKKL